MLEAGDAAHVDAVRELGESRYHCSARRQASSIAASVSTWDIPSDRKRVRASVQRGARNCPEDWIGEDSCAR